MVDYRNDGEFFMCKKLYMRDENLSQSAKWLYTVLSCLNNYWGMKKGFFTRTNDELMKDCVFSDKTLKKAKSELINAGYIKVWHDNIRNKTKSEKQITFKVCCYELLK